jgi:ATP-binding cassette, subfamily B, multidrug efflux pump
MPRNGVINNWKRALTVSSADTNEVVEGGGSAKSEFRVATAADRAAAWRLLVHAARPERRVLLVAFAWLLVAAALTASGPVLGKFFIDNILIARQPDQAAVIVLLGGALLASVIATGVRYWQLVALAGVAMRSVQRLREAVYAHVIRLPLAFFDRAITGQIVSRVTNDTEAVKALYVQVLFVMLDSVITIAVALAAMAILDWRLTLIVSLMVPGVVLIVKFYQHWSAPAVSEARERRSDLNAQVSESIAGMNVLQTTAATGRFAERFANTSLQHYRARMGEVRANAWLLRPALDFMQILLLAGVIFLFGMAQQGSLRAAIEIGVIYAFIVYLARVVEPMIEITFQFAQIQQSVIAAARLNTLLNEAEAQPTVGNAVVTAGQVEFRQVSFAYLPDRPVLHGVSITIEPGQFVGIVGHTGSGKSTLLSLLMRFYTALPGMVTIDGNDVSAYEDTEFRRAVALIPQEPFLLAGSVADNIDMGRGLGLARLQEAAALADAHAFIQALPQGYDTALGEGGARLAVGEKQLIAIARALAGQPRLLLLDEATSHIDSETEQRVQKALGAIRGQCTMIAIAHRLSTIREADQIIVMSHGRVAECGSHESLMQREGGIYRRLYQLQQIEAEWGEA